MSATQATTPKTGPSRHSIGLLPDQAALEFSHGHEDTQLKPSSWVVATGINALGCADERDAHSLQLV
jgi:hypothetical protein